MLNLVLLVEYVEQAYYREALRRDVLQGEVREFATTAAAHEEEHVAALRSALGNAARQAPRTDFGDALSDQRRFALTAARLEDVAVSAYNGGAPSLSPEALGAAAEIVSVEARHAAWIRSIIGEPPAPEPTDDPATADEVLRALREIGLR